LAACKQPIVKALLWRFGARSIHGRALRLLQTSDFGYDTGLGLTAKN
jgi:hypothetical protein